MLRAVEWEGMLAMHSDREKLRNTTNKGDSCGDVPRVRNPA
jgi:hypothetical protein